MPLASKKSSRPSMRLEPELETLAALLMEHHGVKQHSERRNRSEYLRGLIILDAARERLPVEGVDIPAWVAKEFSSLRLLQGEALRTEAVAEMEREHRASRIFSAPIPKETPIYGSSKPRKKG